MVSQLHICKNLILTSRIETHERLTLTDAQEGHTLH